MNKSESKIDKLQTQYIDLARRHKTILLESTKYLQEINDLKDKIIVLLKEQIEVYSQIDILQQENKKLRDDHTTSIKVIVRQTDEIEELNKNLEDCHNLLELQE